MTVIVPESPGQSLCRRFRHIVGNGLVMDRIWTGKVVTDRWQSHSAQPVKITALHTMNRHKVIQNIDDCLSKADDPANAGHRAFDRAYIAVRMRLLSGTLKPGQHLDISTLARSVGVSSSPMREVLCTLAAERLLQSTKGSGFHVPILELAATVDLLKWSDHLTACCAKTKGRHLDIKPRVQDDHVLGVLDLFRSIGHMAANDEISHALMNASLRLHNFYRLELNFLSDAADEVSELEAALKHRQPGLARRFHAFHQRRIAILPDLARFARNSG